MKEDEKYFLKRIFKECNDPYDLKLLYENVRAPRNLIEEKNFPINCKRALYILDKWERKGLYGWGTSVDFGWLTEKGIEAAKALLTEEKT